MSLIDELALLLVERGFLLATAESCTGGGIARDLTAVAGSSAWFDCGFVTYSNESKQRLLGVRPQTLEAGGAVSREVVIEMAEGVLANSQAQLSVATSGIAGPGGGSKEKPVGTVWIAWAEQGKPTRAQRFLFSGEREAVRNQAVTEALKGILLNLTS